MLPRGAGSNHFSPKVTEQPVNKAIENETESQIFCVCAGEVLGFVTGNVDDPQSAAYCTFNGHFFY